MSLYYIHYITISSTSRHRVLHSFPTRRSSDLAEAISPPQFIGLAGRPFSVNETLNAAQKRTIAREAVDRSEEHTSELQSHHDLVCRLLLEKKKISEPNATTRLIAKKA